MTLFQAFGQFAGQAAVEPPSAMILLTPSSTAHSGTSCTINANGSVSFSAVTSFSLNGVFSATYRNYAVSWNFRSSYSNDSIKYRMRASGTDNTSSTYGSQYYNINANSPGAGRNTNNFGDIMNTGDTGASGLEAGYVMFFQPFEVDQTSYISTSTNSYGNARMTEYGGVHETAASYDGFTFFANNGNITGQIAVYGLVS